MKIICMVIFLKSIFFLFVVCKIWMRLIAYCFTSRCVKIAFKGGSLLPLNGVLTLFIAKIAKRRRRTKQRRFIFYGMSYSFFFHEKQA